MRQLCPKRVLIALFVVSYLAACVSVVRAHAGEPAILGQINHSVNASHTYGEPLTDPFVRYLDQDGTYDCENYAMDKVAELHRRGLPGRVVAGTDARGQSHAVAVSGDYVLDSQYQGVYTLDEMRRLGMFKPAQ